MIVIAGVKCGPGGPSNCVQQGRWSVDTIKLQCKTSRWIRKANTETEKLFSKREFLGKQNTHKQVENLL